MLIKKFTMIAAVPLLLLAVQTLGAQTSSESAAPET